VLLKKRPLATPLSCAPLRFRTGGFASPSFDGYAFAKRGRVNNSDITKAIVCTRRHKNPTALHISRTKI
jgi:hypothetical protein